MPYDPTTPAPAEAKKVSQPKILNNFQLLAPLVGGLNNVILFSQQAVVPAVGATQVGIYNELVGGANTLKVKNGANAPVDILTAIKAANGTCALPCGIILKWGSGVIAAGSADEPKLFGALGNFNAIYNVFLSVDSTPTNNAYDGRDWILETTALAITGFNVHRNYYIGAQVNFKWLAIGS